MKFLDHEKNRGIEINTAPMVDVVFLLLIFFIFSSTLVYTDAVNIRLPEMNSQTKMEMNTTIRVQINSSGNLFINGKQTNIVTFQDDIFQESLGNPNTNISIQADKDSYHGDVMEVITLARRAGFTNFAVAVVSENQ